MTREAFFDAVRVPLFGGRLSQEQVDGMEVILDEAERRATPTNDLAYKLATAYHETAHTMQPIHERGSRAYFDKYEPGTRIGKVLGNTVQGDGYRYRGRGFVQLTGRDNYRRASGVVGHDLVANPDLALEPEIATRILFDGMREGWFTGKSIRDFIDTVDEDDDEDLREFIAARRIINGTDRARKIGEYALAFEAALREATRDEQRSPQSGNEIEPDDRGREDDSEATRSPLALLWALIVATAAAIGAEFAGWLDWLKDLIGG